MHCVIISLEMLDFGINILELALRELIDFGSDLSEGIFNIKNSNFLEINLPEETKRNYSYVNNVKKAYDFKFSGIFDENETQENLFQSIGDKVIKK